MDATLGDSTYQPSNVSALAYLDVHVIVVDTRRLLSDFTTAGDRYCVAAVECLPALHYRVYFIFLSTEIMGSILEH